MARAGLLAAMLALAATPLAVDGHQGDPSLSMSCQPCWKAAPPLATTLRIISTLILPQSWSLDFGDGSAPASGTGQPPSNVPHTYAVAGTFQASLEVVDRDGDLRDAHATIVVAPDTTPPVISLVAPKPGWVYAGTAASAVPGGSTEQAVVAPGFRAGCAPPCGSFAFHVSVFDALSGVVRVESFDGDGPAVCTVNNPTGYTGTTDYVCPMPVSLQVGARIWSVVATDGVGRQDLEEVRVLVLD